MISCCFYFLVVGIHIQRTTDATWKTLENILGYKHSATKDPDHVLIVWCTIMPARELLNIPFCSSKTSNLRTPDHSQLSYLTSIPGPAWRLCTYKSISCACPMHGQSANSTLSTSTQPALLCHLHMVDSTVSTNKVRTNHYVSSRFSLQSKVFT